MAELRHRLRHVHLDDLARRAQAAALASAIGASSELQRQAPKMWSSVLAERLGVDVADHRDHQLVAGEDALDVVLEIVARDGGDRLLGALDRTPVRMIAGRRAGPRRARRPSSGSFSSNFRLGEDLRAHALDRILVEAGLASARAATGRTTSSLLAVSVCTLPSITSRLASKSMRMASVCTRSWKATESSSPAPSSIMPETK